MTLGTGHAARGMALSNSGEVGLYGQQVKQTTLEDPTMFRQPIQPTMPVLPGVVAIVLAAAMLVAMLGTMSRVPSPVTAPTGPMPAPAIEVVSGADFPEQARPTGGCRAVVERSSAIDNQRSERANVITTELLSDACFGA